MCDSVTPSPPFSLLKHDDAFLVEASSTSRLTATESKPQSTKGTMGGDPLVSPELMKAMLPSRQEWKDDRGKWQQNVSLAPSSRAEVLDLQAALESNLVTEQAKKVGICANRERLHAQLFDEIIRQVILACPERGRSLLRVRDEIRMTIEAYQALYNTSLSFGIRKTVLAEEGTQEAEDKIAQLQDEIQRLQEQTLQWSHRSMVLTSYYANERDKRTTQQNNVVAALQTQIHQFEAFRDLTK
ncbi:hypothetical protein H257_04857 [Aphanomyces astaci]|uniref:33 kDa inner dynein arm light chain, axonemal n=1 Tax=Aphanomyces astaci TaxID=112090 RepID=W4GVU3_APHAT|nr:hypothetical protein H257_04857 [Aphanomyces astaci]ETV83134.1 hypothetical protein H257_04857 [Aphanomyces astaci]|eukprot:XP_009827805.1 hypothetical protein H257_04857 [Aphanomyces astaci]